MTLRRGEFLAQARKYRVVEDDCIPPDPWNRGAGTRDRSRRLLTSPTQDFYSELPAYAPIAVSVPRATFLASIGTLVRVFGTRPRSGDVDVSE